MYISLLFILYVFGLVCVHFPLIVSFLLLIQIFVAPYVGFIDGASRSTQNISSVAWVI